VIFFMKRPWKKKEFEGWAYSWHTCPVNEELTFYEHSLTTRAFSTCSRDSSGWRWKKIGPMKSLLLWFIVLKYGLKLWLKFVLTKKQFAFIWLKYFCKCFASKITWKKTCMIFFVVVNDINMHCIFNIS